jgi:hypothetical protein
MSSQPHIGLLAQEGHLVLVFKVVVRLVVVDVNAAKTKKQIILFIILVGTV